MRERGGRARAEHLGPERRRPLVLDAAFELLLKHGYEGTSMEAIAAAAGVTKPVVYACYPSKQELFSALFRREERRVLDEIAAALPRTAHADDFERVLGDGFTAFLSAVATSPQAYRVVFLGEGGASAAVARRIQRGRERQVEAVAALARPLLGPDAGDDAVRLVAHVIVGVAEAGARAMLAEPGRWTPEELGEALGRLAVRGAGTLYGPG